MTGYFIWCFRLLVHRDVIVIVFLGRLPAFLCFLKIIGSWLRLDFKATFLTHFPPEPGIWELKWATEFWQVIFKQSLYLALFLLNVQGIYIYFKNLTPSRQFAQFTYANTCPLSGIVLCLLPPLLLSSFHTEQPCSYHSV